jgi:hypothetical protein
VLCRHARLFVSFFQPSFKLIAKDREGAVVRKRYLSPATPCQRSLADPSTPKRRRDKLERLQGLLDPVFLLREIRYRQDRLSSLADKTPLTETVPTETFLAHLQARWHEEAPVSRPIEASRKTTHFLPVAKDPFEACNEELRGWVHAAPHITGKELLLRLQAPYPGAYPDHCFRPLLRRLKRWREELLAG